jgi:hypothetical protein
MNAALPIAAFRHHYPSPSFDRFDMNRPPCPPAEQESTAATDFLSSLLEDLGSDGGRIVLVPDNARPKAVPKGIFAPPPEERHEAKRWSSLGPGYQGGAKSKIEQTLQSPKRRTPTNDDDDGDGDFLETYFSHRQARQMVARGVGTTDCDDMLDREQNQSRWAGESPPASRHRACSSPAAPTRLSERIPPPPVGCSESGGAPPTALSRKRMDRRLPRPSSPSATARGTVNPTSDRQGKR